MISLNELPIIKVNKNNIADEWNNIINKLKDSTFVSIDLELSGLGNRRNLNKPSIDGRYQHLIETASKYSIISIGISYFKLDSYDSKIISFKNETFDLYTLCEDDFIADFETLKFHRKNNFDFNELFSNGIKYYKGKDRQKNLDESEYMRRLIRELSLSNVPIVFHNGLIDLVFLYENFYDKCPTKYMKFISEVADLFPQGLYDTKYIADFHARTKASFLEYLFRRYHYENTNNKTKNKRHFVVEFTQKQVIFGDYHHKEVKNLNEIRSKLCKRYSSHGYCNTLKCNHYHNAHLIVTIEILSLRKESDSSIETNVLDLDTENGIHTSSIDAFMTGFIFAHYLLKYNKVPLNTINDEFCNKFILTGKDHPLIITKSSFEKTQVRKEKGF